MGQDFRKNLFKILFIFTIIFIIFFNLTNYLGLIEEKIMILVLIFVCFTYLLIILFLYQDRINNNKIVLKINNSTNYFLFLKLPIIFFVIFSALLPKAQNFFITKWEDLPQWNILTSIIAISFVYIFGYEFLGIMQISYIDKHLGLKIVFSAFISMFLFNIIFFILNYFLFDLETIPSILGLISLICVFINYRSKPKNIEFEIDVEKILIIIISLMIFFISIIHFQHHNYMFPGDNWFVLIQLKSIQLTGNLKEQFSNYPMFWAVFIYILSSISRISIVNFIGILSLLTPIVFYNIFIIIKELIPNIKAFYRILITLSIYILNGAHSYYYILFYQMRMYFGTDIGYWFLIQFDYRYFYFFSVLYCVLFCFKLINLPEMERNARNINSLLFMISFNLFLGFFLHQIELIVSLIFIFAIFFSYMSLKYVSLYLIKISYFSMFLYLIIEIPLNFYYLRAFTLNISLHPIFQARIDEFFLRLILLVIIILYFSILYILKFKYLFIEKLIDIITKKLSVLIHKMKKFQSMTDKQYFLILLIIVIASCFFDYHGYFWDLPILFYFINLFVKFFTPGIIALLGLRKIQDKRLKKALIISSILLFIVGLFWWADRILRYLLPIIAFLVSYYYYTYNKNRGSFKISLLIYLIVYMQGIPGLYMQTVYFASPFAYKLDDEHVEIINYINNNNIEYSRILINENDWVFSSAIQSFTTLHVIFEYQIYRGSEELNITTVQTILENNSIEYVFINEGTKNQFLSLIIIANNSIELYKTKHYGLYKILN